MMQVYVYDGVSRSRLSFTKIIHVSLAISISKQQMIRFSINMKTNQVF